MTEYEKAFDFAVARTNAAFPFVFTVRTAFVQNGKIISTVTEVDERESQQRERITRTTVEGGKTTKIDQISIFTGRVGPPKVYCSDDGVSWKPPSPYMCFGPVSFYGQRTTERVVHSVAKKYLAGKRVKVYREYSAFVPTTPNGKKDFRETLSTINSRGFLISVVDTEGTLYPRKVTLRRMQTWKKAKIKPVVAPIF